MLTLETPLSEINGVGPRFLRALAKLKIDSVRDLLRHFPVRYEDFSDISKIANLEPGQPVTIQATIHNVRSRRAWRRRMTITEAVLSDDSGSLKAIWFNQPFIQNILRPGRLSNFSGKVSLSDNGKLYLSHPTYEIINKRLAEQIGETEDQETKHTGRLVPVYSETRGLTSKGLRFLIHPIVKNLEELPEWVPEEILKKSDLPEINRAVRDIHFPEKLEDALEARKRFDFEDLFLLQLFNVSQKLELKKETAPSLETNTEKLKEFLDELPFELTASQKISLWEIIKDLKSPRPMNRLLQGDVGSGKTVVAVLAAFIASQNGWQSAFMAPTEVLANQHFATLKKFFAAIPEKDQPVTCLLTAGSSKIFYVNDMESEITKSELAKKIASGEIKIIIGTHALIQKSVKFKNLGLVIIDEQHRFGVKQRQFLTSNSNSVIPHFLSMSATPIPRTLMLTVFGDLDISAITELPAGRKEIITKVVAPENREKAYAFVRGQVRKGRQVFVVCPRIEKTENNQEQTPVYARRFDDIKNVTEEYEKLSQKVFPDLKVGMLHGKIKSKEKGKIMEEFKKRKIDILVSTSVIEVGVDVPNASIMWIDSAERFGLSQLYQLRGRIGRGEHQSFCLLFTNSDSQNTKARLEAILKAKNGFELAEKDLQLRGPGEFLGVSQTGLPDTAMKALQNPELIKTARESALALVNSSHDLKKYPALKKRLENFQNKIHLE